jgi:hypothetical protein
MSMTYEDELKQRLAPSAVTANLIRVSATVTAYELLKSVVIDSIRDFFAREWDYSGPGPIAKPSETYRVEVLSRSTSVLNASLAWLVTNGAITQEDADTFQRLREERNRMVHEIGRVLVDPTILPDDQLLGRALVLSRSLAVFWGRIHIETDPEFDGQEIEDESIQSGTSLLLEYLLHLAGGMASAFDQLASTEEWPAGASESEPNTR